MYTLIPLIFTFFKIIIVGVFIRIAIVVYDGRHYFDPHFLSNPSPMIPSLIQPVSVPSSQKIEDSKQESAPESPTAPATPTAPVVPSSQVPETPVKNEAPQSTNQLISESTVPSEPASALFSGWKVPVLVNNGNMEEKHDTSRNIIIAIF